MPSTKAVKIAFATFIFLMVAISARAQRKAAVSGFLVDKAGGVIAGANMHVMLASCMCSRCKDPTKCECCPDQVTVQTGKDGSYAFSLDPGRYTVEVGNKKATVTLEKGKKTMNIKVE
jgi:hypothetical protein